MEEQTPPCRSHRDGARSLSQAFTREVIDAVSGAQMLGVLVRPRGKGKVGEGHCGRPTGPGPPGVN